MSQEKWRWLKLSLLGELGEFVFGIAENRGRRISPGRPRTPWHRHRPRWVPSTFLLACVDGDIVGRVSIRHELNAYLASVASHIGYAVRPTYRRRGYARSILRQSLELARDIGLRRVLITCDDDNVASVSLIESFGGRLESVITTDTGSMPTRRSGSIWPVTIVEQSAELALTPRGGVGALAR